jgi:hypothetical protein
VLVLDNQSVTTWNKLDIQITIVYDDYKCFHNLQLYSINYQSSCIIRTLSTLPEFDISKMCIAESQRHIGWLRLIIYSGAYILPFFTIGFIYPSRTPMHGFNAPNCENEYVVGWKRYIYGVTYLSVDLFWFFKFYKYFLPPNNNNYEPLICIQEKPEAKLKGLHKKLVNTIYLHLLAAISYY